MKALGNLIFELFLLASVVTATPALADDENPKLWVYELELKTRAGPAEVANDADEIVRRARGSCVVFKRTGRLTILIRGQKQEELITDIEVPVKFFESLASVSRATSVAVTADFWGTLDLTETQEAEQVVEPDARHAPE
jgi:hypothetical protein